MQLYLFFRTRYRSTGCWRAKDCLLANHWYELIWILCKGVWSQTSICECHMEKWYFRMRVMRRYFARFFMPSLVGYLPVLQTIMVSIISGCSAFRWCHDFDSKLIGDHYRKENVLIWWLTLNAESVKLRLIGFEEDLNGTHCPATVDPNQKTVSGRKDPLTITPVELLMYRGNPKS